MFEPVPAAERDGYGQRHHAAFVFPGRATMQRHQSRSRWGSSLCQDPTLARSRHYCSRFRRSSRRDSSGTKSPTNSAMRSYRRGPRCQQGAISQGHGSKARTGLASTEKELPRRRRQVAFLRQESYDENSTCDRAASARGMPSAPSSTTDTLE